MASPRIVQKAVDAARKLVAPVVDSVSKVGPVPDALWRDPYVLGYLALIAGMAGEVATDGRLSEKELTRASFRALGSIAGKNPHELREAVEGGGSDAVAEFEDGFFAAMKIAAVYRGIDDELAADEDVKGAVEFVAKNKAKLDSLEAPDDELSRVVKVLEATLFMGYVMITYFPDRLSHAPPPDELPVSSAS